ncbi:ArgE/DapE family deacylase [candidate division KSB1 bacterium]|nr:ArgE/DapE family deacylase [candidate division KSB1 bacterium]
MNSISQKISACVDSLSAELFSFIQTLVQTPSLSGKEQEIQELIAAKLKNLNLEVDIVPSILEELKDHPAFCDDGIPFKDRINVVGHWKGTSQDSKANSLILNGHVDVVSTGKEELWHDSPWSGKIENGKLYGRGSCDMKSGLASGIFAIAALQKLGFQPAKDVVVESVIGEESGGIGSLTTIIKGYSADAVIILEPTQLKLCPVQAGALTFRLKVVGQSIHACMKKYGVSAIEKFYQILRAIDELEQQRHNAFNHYLYKDRMNVAPISIGTITGGEWHSTVPEEVTVEGRYGVMPGESIDAAKQVFTATLRQVCKSDPWLKEHPPELEWFEGQFESGFTDVKEPIIASLSKSHHEVMGEKPKLEGVTYGSDLRLFTNHGKMPAVLYGPGDVRNAHAVNEYVSLEEVLKCTKVLALTISEWSLETK